VKLARPFREAVRRIGQLALAPAVPSSPFIPFGAWQWTCGLLRQLESGPIHSVTPVRALNWLCGHNCGSAFRRAAGWQESVSKNQGEPRDGWSQAEALAGILLPIAVAVGAGVCTLIQDRHNEAVLAQQKQREQLVARAQQIARLLEHRTHSP